MKIKYLDGRIEIVGKPTRLERVRNAKGSNQYKAKKKARKDVTAQWAFIGLCILVTLIGIRALELEVRNGGFNQAYAEAPILSPLPDDVPELEKMTLEQQGDWKALQRIAHKLAPLYDFPPKVIIAQMALESARGTSNYCVNRNNCFGIGAYDSNPDKAFHFENKEQAIIEYMRLIRTRYTDAYEARSNPELMIELIKKGGYATDPNYVAKIKNLHEWKTN